MWLIVGFGALGLLVGNLVGLTSEPVVASTIGLLFSSIGGSVILFLHKLQQDERRLAGQLILALASSTLLGIFTGIYISEHRTLSPNQARSSPAENKYLRSATASEVMAIDLAYNNHAITSEQAYSQLRALITRGQKE